MESFFHGNKINRCRYGHQVSPATFRKLAGDAFMIETKGKEKLTAYAERVTKKSKSSVHAQYWFQMMSLEIVLFIFVRNLTEANFEMFVTCKAIVPWMFALAHVHYTRWLPLYLRDLEMLHAPSLYKQFLDGHFTVKKTNCNFSNIAIDQAHEQDNKLVKIDAGAMGILDSPHPLPKWSVASPEITSMLNDIYDDLLHILLVRG